MRSGFVTSAAAAGVDALKISQPRQKSLDMVRRYARPRRAPQPRATRTNGPQRVSSAATSRACTSSTLSAIARLRTIEGMRDYRVALTTAAELLMKLIASKTKRPLEVQFQTAVSTRPALGSEIGRAHGRIGKNGKAGLPARYQIQQPHHA
jgi:hypothetical protein